MRAGQILLVLLSAAAILIIPADLFYASRFVPRFKEIERQRIVTSNQLATAKIVTENLDHVRELVYGNMEFPGQKDSVNQEAMLFAFLTECVNDLKMRLVSVKPLRPTVAGLLTTYGYEVELQGDYFSLGEFCAKLENSQRLVMVASFDVTLDRMEESGDKGTSPAPPRLARIRMHLDTFRLKKG